MATDVVFNIFIGFVNFFLNYFREADYFNFRELCYAQLTAATHRSRAPDHTTYLDISLTYISTNRDNSSAVLTTESPSTSLDVTTSSRSTPDIVILDDSVDEIR